MLPAKCQGSLNRYGEQGVLRFVMAIHSKGKRQAIKALWTSCSPALGFWFYLECEQDLPWSGRAATKGDRI
jgi:hypothetical protein